MKATTRQNLRLHLLFVWGFISILVCAGEDIPGQPMSDLQFFGSKFIGIISFWLCYRTGRKWKQKGLLPKIKEED